MYAWLHKADRMPCPVWTVIDGFFPKEHIRLNNCKSQSNASLLHKLIAEDRDLYVRQQIVIQASKQVCHIEDEERAKGLMFRLPENPDCKSLCWLRHTNEYYAHFLKDYLLLVAPMMLALSSSHPGRSLINMEVSLSLGMIRVKMTPLSYRLITGLNKPGWTNSSLHTIHFQCNILASIANLGTEPWPWISSEAVQLSFLNKSFVLWRACHGFMLCFKRDLPLYCHSYKIRSWNLSLTLPDPRLLPSLLNLQIYILAARHSPASKQVAPFRFSLALLVHPTCRN